MTDKARILFVDDEKRVLNAMRGLFRRDYDLYLTCDGADAVRIVTEHDVDVIVADQRMPGMTGIEVLGKVKDQSPRTVRILLTGYADPSAVEGSINIGEVFRFLSKPCPPQMLRETLNLAVDAARTAPVVEAPTIPAPDPVRSAEPKVVAKPVATPDPVRSAEPKVAVKPVATPDPVRPIEPIDAPAVSTVVKPIAPVPELAASAPVEPAAAAPQPPTPPAPSVVDDEDTQPRLPKLQFDTVEDANEHSSTHWQSVTNVVMSEDSVEETQQNVALTSATLGVNDVGVVVFTVDSDFATAAIRSVSAERDVVLATSLVKVAQAIEKHNAGVLVTDFTTNSAILQKIIGALKQHMPELVTIVVSNGRDTTDMISLINYGQVFRYVLKPIQPKQLRSEIHAAVIRHLYLLNNPESMQRHNVISTPRTGEGSQTVNEFIGNLRTRPTRQTDPKDTIT